MVSADPDPASLLESAATDDQPTPSPDATATASPYGMWSEAQKALFGLMAIAIFVLLIGLAANADSTPTPPPVTEPPCWSFDDDCCIEQYGWDECCGWPDRRDDRGLFDAEEGFADDPLRRERCG